MTGPGLMDAASLGVARRTKGFMPDAEGLALHRAASYAASSGLGPLLEIGTYCGKSAIYLGSAARSAGATVFTIDHHRGSEETQPGSEFHDPEVTDARSGRIDTLPWARRSLEEADLDATVILVVGPSAVVAGAWSTPLAMLFIDGGHGEDVAWSDYRAWTPKVAPGGWLAIHDVFPDPADGGRPPYELYLDALSSGEWNEDVDAGCGSLRVLRRLPATT